MKIIEINQEIEEFGELDIVITEFIATYIKSLNLNKTDNECIGEALKFMLDLNENQGLQRERLNEETIVKCDRCESPN